MKAESMAHVVCLASSATQDDSKLKIKTGSFWFRNCPSPRSSAMSVWSPGTWKNRGRGIRFFHQWLLAQMNFNMSKELPDGSDLVIPPWFHCLSSELEIRERCLQAGHMLATWESGKHCGQSSVTANTARTIQLVAEAHSSSSHQSLDKAEFDNIRRN